MPDVDDPRLLRIDVHAQLLQDFEPAASSATRASVADVQVMTQSSAYLVS